jgi:ADP-ribose pyrophosphatase YjhB (NUDIX family)
MSKTPPPDPLTADLPFSVRVPEGDTRPRKVCDTCGFIAYQNPKIVVGAVVSSADKLLLCRRAIEPRRGFWTIPAGYLEEGETLEEGVHREVHEEATADIAIDQILAVYSVRHLSQVQIFYRANLIGSFAPGPESLETALFSSDDLPWGDLAFPSVHWVLKAHHAARGKLDFCPFGNP